MNLIETKNLSFSYQGKENTLKNINIQIKQGTFTCIVGENGSGKSTLLKCILGLNKGYTGEIIKENYIGYLPQKTVLKGWCWSETPECGYGRLCVAKCHPSSSCRSRR